MKSLLSENTLLYLIFTLAVLCPLTAAAFPGVLILLVVFIALLSFQQRILICNIWGQGFLGLLLVYLLATFSLEVGAYEAREFLFQIPNISNLTPRSSAIFGATITYACFFILSTIFIRFNKSRAYFGNGLILGYAISILLVLLEWQIPDLIYFGSENYYWTSINRIAGPFSDPNALGVFLVLILPFLYDPAIAKLRSYQIVLTACSLLLGAISGSRSFFLALFIYIFIFLFYKQKKLLILFVSAFLLLTAGINFSSRPFSTGLVGPDRLVQALDFENLEQTLFSRTLFWSIATKVWLKYPLFGIGPDKFKEYVPVYADMAKANTGLWTDNPNNFYLGILAEYGLIGLFLLSLSVLALKLRPDAKIYSKYSVLALVILLLFGPHLEFIEIAILTAWLVGSCFEERQPIVLPKIFYLAIYLAVAANQLFNGYGLYAWETENQQLRRWTNQQAKFWLRCNSSQIAELELRLLHPDIGKRPVLVSISSPTIITSKQIYDFSNQKFSFECQELSSLRSSMPQYLPITLKLSRTWIPSAYNYGNDNRLLGAQIILKDLQELQTAR